MDSYNLFGILGQTMLLEVESKIAELIAGQLTLLEIEKRIVEQMNLLLEVEVWVLGKPLERFVVFVDVVVAQAVFAVATTVLVLLDNLLTEENYILVLSNNLLVAKHYDSVLLDLSREEKKRIFFTTNIKIRHFFSFKYYLRPVNIICRSCKI